MLEDMNYDVIRAHTNSIHFHESYTDNMPIIELIENARRPYFKAILSFGYNASYVELATRLLHKAFALEAATEKI